MSHRPPPTKFGPTASAQAKSAPSTPAARPLPPPTRFAPAAAQAKSTLVAGSRPAPPPTRFAPAAAQAKSTLVAGSRPAPPPTRYSAGHVGPQVVQPRAAVPTLALKAHTVRVGEATGTRAPQMMPMPASRLPPPFRPSPTNTLQASKGKAVKSSLRPTVDGIKKRAIKKATAQDLAKFAFKRYKDHMEGVTSRKGKNIAVARFQQGGKRWRLKAMSGTGKRLKRKMHGQIHTKVPKSNEMKEYFDYSKWVEEVDTENPHITYPENTDVGFMTHKQDSEAKILNDLLGRTDVDTVGELMLYTQRPPCFSCRDVIENFKESRKKIDVVIYHGKSGAGNNYSDEKCWTAKEWSD